MKFIVQLAGAAVALASFGSAHAYGTQYPQHDPFLDMRQCVIVKQVRRADQVVLHSNRVCPSMYKVVDLFESAQMGERKYSDRFGPSALVHAKIRFFGNLATHHDMDGRLARVWIKEMGPTGVKYEANETVELAHGKPMVISTASGVDLWMVIDQNRTPNSFDQVLTNRNPVSNSVAPRHSGDYYSGANSGSANYSACYHTYAMNPSAPGYRTSHHHHEWNPSCWDGMTRQERTEYLFNHR